jgi:hypothetical protein
MSNEDKLTFIVNLFITISQYYVKLVKYRISACDVISFITVNLYQQ